MTATASVLIVFVKNPRPGSVKTRLAESVGDEKALHIYQQLLQYTRRIVEPLEVQKQVWFSERIPANEFWNGLDYQTKVQRTGDLGRRMEGAAVAAFSEGYEKVVIIGSDCAELTSALVEEAFDRLDRDDLVFGPSEDGGYYLVGMNGLYRYLFSDMPWSTDRLLRQTTERIDQHGHSYSLLTRLNDVDTEEDWNRVKDNLPG